jgi:hypothetical protein
MHLDIQLSASDNLTIDLVPPGQSGEYTVTVTAYSAGAAIDIDFAYLGPAGVTINAGSPTVDDGSSALPAGSSTSSFTRFERAFTAGPLRGLQLALSAASAGRVLVEVA